MKIHHTVKRHLKHTFIPHEGNDYKPHFFREFSIALLLVVALGLFAVSVSSALVIQKTEAGARIVVKVLVDLTNENRIANNLRALVHNPQLDQAAQLKADDMVRTGYFAHFSPSGVTPWYWFGKVGYYFLYAGENLAVNFSESDAVERAWMKSPLHRANILDNRFEEIGIATSLGSYEGNNTTFVVQLFGTPAFAQTTNNEKKAAVKDTTTNATPTLKVSFVKKNPIKVSVSSSTGSTTVATVQGEQADINDVISPVVDTQSFAMVENESATKKELANVAIQEVPQYATWYERFLYNSPGWVSILYIVLIGIIAIALFLFIFVEIKRQHPKHIAYGVLMLTIFSVLLYLNQTEVVMVIPRLLF